MNHFFMALLLSLPTSGMAMSFTEAINKIKAHDKLASISSQAKADMEKSSEAGSWGDPMLKITGKNFPADSLKDDQTPMTGMEVAISQRLPLSNKYSHKEESLEKMSQAKQWQASYTENQLISMLWKHLISLRKLQEQQGIIKENIQWISKVIEVSKTLYSNGKVSQQGILDLKIRKSELKSQLFEKKFAINSTKEQIRYLVGADGAHIDLSTVPWQQLKFQQSQDTSKDPMELSLKSSLESKSAATNAASSNRVPDITIGLGYTMRSDIDNNGDFVSLSAQIPLPVSSKRGAAFRKNLLDQKSAEQSLANYKRQRDADLKSLEFNHQSLSAQLNTLRTESISFAKNAREITMKSYRLGTATYIALLQSEIKLQNLQMKRSDLVARRSLNSVQYKSILGAKLYD